MSAIEVLTGNGKKQKIDTDGIEAIKSSLRGEVLLPGHERYDQAREIWNAMIDRKPAIIIQCLGAADVKIAVDFAAKYNLLAAVRSGGHNIAGNAVCDDGLMIDLSQMKSVRIDQDSMLVHVEPGVSLGDLDHETQAFGLATPVGINSTTGVAGLTLGGGFGWLSRKYGMTIDCLTAVDVVTADGKYIHANKDNHSDIFWAVRGGGGNFGIITRFEFQLYPVGPEVLAGLIVFPLEDAASALKKYREYARTLGDDTSVWVVMRQAPPLPFLPEDVHGKDVIVFALCHIGDLEEGKKIIEPIRSFGKMAGEHVGEMPFTAWQQAFDPLLTPGARNYWKSHNFNDISDEVIDLAIKYTKTLPSPQCEIFFAMLGGETSRIAKDATAYPHRDANYLLNVHGRWDEAGDDEKCIGWARDFFNDSAPHATGGVYINFMTEEETERVKSAYGPSFDRLKDIKKKYDPNNLFKLNQNIAPSK